MQTLPLENYGNLIYLKCKIPLGFPSIDSVKGQRAEDNYTAHKSFRLFRIYFSLVWVLDNKFTLKASFPPTLSFPSNFPKDNFMKKNHSISFFLYSSRNSNSCSLNLKTNKAIFLSSILFCMLYLMRILT